MLKVRVKDIPSQGMEIAEKDLTDKIDVQGDQVAVTVGNLEVKAKLEKFASTILAQTRIQCTYTADCARCLEPVVTVWKERYAFNFAFDQSTEFIDLTEDVRQEVILNIPPRLLCKEDCKGICPGCGVNLNSEPCQCKK